MHEINQAALKARAGSAILIWVGVLRVIFLALLRDILF